MWNFVLIQITSTFLFHTYGIIWNKAWCWFLCVACVCTSKPCVCQTQHGLWRVNSAWRHGNLPPNASLPQARARTFNSRLLNKTLRSFNRKNLASFWKCWSKSKGYLRKRTEGWLKLWKDVRGYFEQVSVFGGSRSGASTQFVVAQAAV